jgi:hypothetical protein
VEHFSAQQGVMIDDIYGAGEALFARKFSDTNTSLLRRIDEMAETKELKSAQIC